MTFPTLGSGVQLPVIVVVVASNLEVICTWGVMGIFLTWNFFILLLTLSSSKELRSLML